ncbi:hypothetical protein Tcan_11456 [Toxocara canis]|uniref:Uncharacterized protein n=1 Tax=Toxocara canis TaxID=6265 RepID=A0A0B2V546_TOXCA|nr:hypothetical protein Tcan_11456 [Toxocara canis]
MRTIRESLSNFSLSRFTTERCTCQPFSTFFNAWYKCGQPETLYKVSRKNERRMAHKQRRSCSMSTAFAKMPSAARHAFSSLINLFMPQPSSSVARDQNFSLDDMHERKLHNIQSFTYSSTSMLNGYAND